MTFSPSIACCIKQRNYPLPMQNISGKVVWSKCKSCAINCRISGILRTAQVVCGLNSTRCAKAKMNQACPTRAHPIKHHCHPLHPRRNSGEVDASAAGAVLCGCKRQLLGAFGLRYCTSSNIGCDNAIIWQPASTDAGNCSRAVDGDWHGLDHHPAGAAGNRDGYPRVYRYRASCHGIFVGGQGVVGCYGLVVFKENGISAPAFGPTSNR